MRSLKNLAFLKSLNHASTSAVFKVKLKVDCQNRGSYMSAHVYFEFIKRVGEKRYKTRLAENFISFSQRV